MKREVYYLFLSFVLQKFDVFIAGEVHSEIKKAYVLTENDALRVKAKENFEEEGVKRQSGDEWLIFGPRFVLLLFYSCLFNLFILKEENLYIFVPLR